MIPLKYYRTSSDFYEYSLYNTSFISCSLTILLYVFKCHLKHIKSMLNLLLNHVFFGLATFGRFNFKKLSFQSVSQYSPTLKLTYVAYKLGLTYNKLESLKTIM